MYFRNPFLIVVGLTLAGFARAQLAFVEVEREVRTDVVAQVSDSDICEGLYYSGYADECGNLVQPHRFRCGGREAGVSANGSFTTGAAYRWQGTTNAHTSADESLAGLYSRARAYGLVHLRLQSEHSRTMRITASVNASAAFESVQGERDRGEFEIYLFGDSTQNPGTQLQFNWDYDIRNGTNQAAVDQVVSIPAGEVEVYVTQSAELETRAPHIATEFMDLTADFEMSVEYCHQDLNWDNRVDIADLALMLQRLGTFGERENGDLTGDRRINLDDLAALLAGFGNTCNYMPPNPDGD